MDQHTGCSKNLWVFCCGLFRSGSTLQYQFTAELIERNGKGQRLGYADDEIEFSQVLQQSIFGMNVLKAHKLVPEMQRLFEQNCAYGIGIYRDIRDVAVSAMKMLDISFETLIKQEVLEWHIQQFEQWSNQPRMLISKYEVMTTDIVEEVLRIANHLQLDCSECIAAEIAAQYSLEKQYDRVRQIALTKDMLAVDGAYWNTDSLLHYNHISNGGSGAWKTVLSSEQAAFLEFKYGDWLTAKSYELFYS